jgi:hypothetical protein
MLTECKQHLDGNVPDSFEGRPWYDSVWSKRLADDDRDRALDCALAFLKTFPRDLRGLSMRRKALTSIVSNINNTGLFATLLGATVGGWLLRAIDETYGARFPTHKVPDPGAYNSLESLSPRLPTQRHATH